MLRLNLLATREATTKLNFRDSVIKKEGENGYWETQYFIWTTPSPVDGIHQKSRTSWNGFLDLFDVLKDASVLGPQSAPRSRNLGGFPTEARELCPRGAECRSFSSEACALPPLLLPAAPRILTYRHSCSRWWLKGGTRFSSEPPTSPSP